eukprot:CAMPEP_0116925778 /NCGR_PEP_ID=MMETSP0467-20121206/24322_1 /TAXON_ID=283647 /ORGANISM="Mesodinium pulex, Strain SPMC105" /LENGTH=157 /DNA_ID=CAMNT_0004604889 /DNA_START=1500 /DNA_END=1973 /DNA_ORIENTATION=-
MKDLSHEVDIFVEDSKDQDQEVQKGKDLNGDLGSTSASAALERTELTHDDCYNRVKQLIDFDKPISEVMGELKTGAIEIHFYKRMQSFREQLKNKNKTDSSDSSDSSVSSSSSRAEADVVQRLFNYRINTRTKWKFLFYLYGVDLADGEGKNTPQSK